MYLKLSLFLCIIDILISSIKTPLCIFLFFSLISTICSLINLLLFSLVVTFSKTFNLYFPGFNFLKIKEQAPFIILVLIILSSSLS